MLNTLINNEDDLEKLLKLILAKSSDIETKRIIEKIISGVIKPNDNLIQIDKVSEIDEKGGVREVDTFHLKTFACGCKSDGRKNLGGVDYRGNVVCSRHLYRCIRCKRPLSILTVRPIRGIAYCARCRRLVRFLRFVGLKK